MQRCVQCGERPPSHRPIVLSVKRLDDRLAETRAWHPGCAISVYTSLGWILAIQGRASHDFDLVQILTNGEVWKGIPHYPDKEE